MYSIYASILQSYFNPRPHEEGDTISFDKTMTLEISIHALMKRATAELTNAKLGKHISIHALMKRATASKLITIIKQIIFQSTPS